MQCGEGILHVKWSSPQNGPWWADTRNLLEVFDMSIILIVVMIPWVFVSVQSHQIVSIKYVWFLFINHT